MGAVHFSSLPYWVSSLIRQLPYSVVTVILTTCIDCVATGCAASLLVVSITFLFDSQVADYMTVFGLACFLAWFSSGIGPGNWVVVSEIFATSIRAKAMCIAVLPNRITATIMASTFLTFSDLLTWPGFFMVLVAICLAGAWFLYKYLPETKGKSLEEMAGYFAAITGDQSLLELEAKLKQRVDQMGGRVSTSTIPEIDDDDDQTGKEHREIELVGDSPSSH